jgi:RNA polymerase sigma-70 factor (ECF subfamily)
MSQIVAGSGAALARKAALGDHELVERARHGDRAAFESLVVRHRAKLLKVAVRMTQNRTDAEDVVQEALFHGYRSLASFSGNAAFATWLCRIAVNVTLMHRRAARCRPSPQLEPTRANSGVERREAQTLERGSSAEDHLDRVRLVRQLERALTPLDEWSRIVLSMRTLEGASTREVAEHLRISPVAVRQRLRRARLSILRELESLRDCATAPSRRGGQRCSEP